MEIATPTRHTSVISSTHLSLEHASKMFTLNENWAQSKFAGETQLHRDLFGATEGPSVDTAACRSSKAKPRKKKEIARVKIPPQSGASSKDIEDSEVEEAVRVSEDKREGSTAAAVKNRKRKQKRNRIMEDMQAPSKRKKAKLLQDLNDSTSSQVHHNLSLCTEDSEPISQKKSSKDKRKRNALHSKMAGKMEGARFRWINEQLYTTTGHQAKQMFDEDPSLFGVYHTGFSTQVSKWPLNPLEKIIAYVKSLPPDFVVADFGCGEAKLAQSVPHTVHSFDLVAANSSVTACDMAHVPLAKCSVDVVVFCLSLMGSNVSDFIQEAGRVLRKGGLLKICEIASRIDSVEDFIGSVELFGFKLIRKDTIGKMFLDFEFKTTTVAKRGSGDSSSIPTIHLNPCIYKRR